VIQDTILLSESLARTVEQSRLKLQVEEVKHVGVTVFAEELVPARIDKIAKEAHRHRRSTPYAIPNTGSEWPRVGDDEYSGHLGMPREPTKRVRNQRIESDDPRLAFAQQGVSDVCLVRWHLPDRPTELTLDHLVEFRLFLVGFICGGEEIRWLRRPIVNAVTLHHVDQLGIVEIFVW